jgi:pilus assembly protein Flp/PilA
MYHVVGYVRTRLRAVPRTERGASAVEFGLLIALIAIVMVGGVTWVAHNVRDAFSPSGIAQSHE